MADLLYYAKERASVAASFPVFITTPCDFRDAKILIERLAKEHEVRIDSIVPTSGNRNSHWNPRRREIRLNVWKKSVNESWRTAIHEFAHALDDKLRPNAARWHDGPFMDLVLDLCGVIVERGWHLSIPIERAIAEAAEFTRRADREAARAVREAALSAPAAVRARKIEKRREQIARLERKLKNLTTRLASARRSLAALERAASKKETKP